MAEAKPGGSSTTRVVLILVLVVLIGALIVDRKQLGQASAAYERVDAIVPEDDAAPKSPVSVLELPTPEQVREKVGREPDGPRQKVGGEQHETYSWRGVFRTYTVYVAYMGSHSLGLKRVSLNKPFEVVPEPKAPPIDMTATTEAGPAPPGSGQRKSSDTAAKDKTQPKVSSSIPTEPGATKENPPAEPKPSEPKASKPEKPADAKPAPTKPAPDAAKPKEKEEKAKPEPKKEA